MNVYDVAIIGAGPVGMFSIFANGMQTLSCAIIDALDKLGGQCACLYPEKYIYDIPGFPKITGKELIDNLAAQIEPFHANVQLHSFVKNITKSEHNVFNVDIETQGQANQIQARAIIIALGAGVFKPIKPELPNVAKYENKNVFYFVNDLKKFENKTVVIAGGGDSAVDWALMLAEIAKKVYLVHRRDHIKAHPASWEQVKQSSKIELKIPYQIESIIEQGDEFKGLCIKNSDIVERLECDYFVPCFGLRSDLSFLEEWNLELKNHRIHVNPCNMRTNLPGIYAIGDCVWYENKRKLIVSGFSEAMQAATDIYGYLYPDRAPIIGHSTTLGVPNQ